MNVPREHGGQSAKGRFDALAHQLLVVGPPRLVPPARVTPALYGEGDRVLLSRRVLGRVVCVPAVHEQLAAFWQRERQDTQTAHVVSRTRQEGELHGYALFGRDDLH